MVGLEPKHKKEFQLERLILFSDAVFAIAITLLIIEIKVPHVEDKSSLTLFHELVRRIPLFVGFIISFLLIGQFWITHHKLFGFVKSYDGKLLWLNLFFLMSIVTMPFSTALYSENIFVDLSFIVYCINVAATGIINSLAWRYVGNPNNKIVEEGIDHDLFKYFSMRALLIPAAFLIAIPLTLINPWAGKYAPILIAPMMKFVNKKYKSVIEKHKLKLAEEKSTEE